MGLARKQKQTHHGIVRMAERMGINNKKIATDIIRKASQSGLDICDFPDGAFRDYLFSKKHNKRIKVYKGFVFIFNKTSDRVITLYKIPTEYMEEYEKYGQ